MFVSLDSFIVGFSSQKVTACACCFLLKIVNSACPILCKLQNQTSAISFLFVVFTYKPAYCAVFCSNTFCNSALGSAPMDTSKIPEINVL